jgi:hypothetical protein
MMFFGMSRSFSVLHPPWSYLANALLNIPYMRLLLSGVGETLRW